MASAYTYNCQVHKADDIGSTRPQNLALYANKQISGEFNDAALKRLYAQDAHKIVEALTSTLPGGTLDHIFCELAQRKAHSLRVRIGDVRA